MDGSRVIVADWVGTCSKEYEGDGEVITCCGYEEFDEYAGTPEEYVLYRVSWVGE